MIFKGDISLKSRMDDAFMLKFLRARKYCVNKAFKLVSNQIILILCILCSFIVCTFIKICKF